MAAPRGTLIGVLRPSDDYNPKGKYIVYPQAVEDFS
jgi:hypothetical protein